YFFSEGTYTQDEREGIFPGFEANYGLLPEVQLSMTAPFTFEKETDSEKRSGYGDTEIGVKYRFIQEDEEGWRPQMSLYPSWELPTKDSGEEPVGAEVEGQEKHTREFLPLW